MRLSNIAFCLFVFSNECKGTSQNVKSQKDIVVFSRLDVTNFSQYQSETCFRDQNGTYFRLAHNANLKHVSEWHIFFRMAHKLMPI